MEIEPIGKRLRELMRHYNLNMNSFSVKVGLSSNSVITRIVNDPERGMSLDYLQKVLLTFRDISAEWLVLGEGEMFKTKQTEEQKVTPAELEEIRKRCTDLEKENKHLKELIASKDEVIKTKEELIGALRR